MFAITNPGNPRLPHPGLPPPERLPQLPVGLLLLLAGLRVP